MLLHVLSITLILASGVLAYGNVDRLEELFTEDKLKEIFKNRCLKYADLDTFTEILEVDIPNIEPCSLHIRDSAVNDESGKQAAFQCIEVPLKKIERCLNSEEKYLPQLLFNSYGTHIGDLESTLQSVNCTLELDDLADELVGTCLLGLDVVKNMDKPEFVLKKSILCRDFKSASKCAIDGIKSNCNDSDAKKLTQYFTIISGSFTGLCADVSANLI